VKESAARAHACEFYELIHVFLHTSSSPLLFSYNLATFPCLSFLEGCDLAILDVLAVCGVDSVQMSLDPRYLRWFEDASSDVTSLFSSLLLLFPLAPWRLDKVVRRG
jgi:hypothetical protein